MKGCDLLVRLLAILSLFTSLFGYFYAFSNLPNYSLWPPTLLFILIFVLYIYSILYLRTSGLGLFASLLIISSWWGMKWLYDLWSGADVFFSIVFIIRILSVLYFFLSALTIVLYIRAWDTYKRSRGNQEISKKPHQLDVTNIITLIKKLFIKQSEKEVVTINFNLGIKVDEEKLGRRGVV